MTLTYGSLFAGVGGFDMGMEQAGYEPVFQVEWDKNCQKILHHHWPTVPKWGDVCDVNGADLPPCDVLIFGSPCQDLSVAGKRAGLQDGDRSSMFFEAVRIIKEMRDATNSIYPRATIWENVPGALSSNKGADFGVVLSSMADIGAITQEYAVLDAQYFRSTPQRRRRIFLVSIFDPAASERCPDPLLPLIQGSRGDFAKGRKARKDAARLAEASVDPGDGEEIAYTLLNFAEYGEGIGTLRASGGDLGGGSETLVAAQLFIAEPQPTYSFDTQFGSNAAVFEDQSPTLKSSQQPPSVSMAFSHYSSDASPSIEISPTLRSGTNGTGHAVLTSPGLAVRRLTPLECERLMGWPDDHTRWTADGKEQADTNRYKQCGNGVASPVAKWVGEQLRPVLETE